MTEKKSSERKAESSLLSAVLLFAPLSVLGSLLIEKTHHRPLGAATFASIAVLAWLLSEAFVRTALSSSRPQGLALRRAAWGIGTAASAAALFAALV